MKSTQDIIKESDAVKQMGMDWKPCGDGLKAIDVFTNEAIPSTEDFDNWFDWAAALLSAVNPRT